MSKKIEKFEDIHFTVRPEKLKFVIDYARKNNVAIDMVASVPKSSVADFEKFLDDNQVCDPEFDEFIEKLLGAGHE